MSAAGERLRAERVRFERELQRPDAIRTAAVGTDDSAHFLADTPRVDDESVWDLPGDETPSRTASGKSGPVMPTTPYRDTMLLSHAAPTVPPSPKLESPTSDITASIREALDAAERGLRASVIATDQMERLARSRGTHATASRSLETPGDTAAQLAAGDEDPEAQAYLQGVLRMIYGVSGEDETDEEDEHAPARALRTAVAHACDGTTNYLLGDDSEREAVVARRAHTHANAAFASSLSRRDSPVAATTGGPDAFAYRTSAAVSHADFAFQVFGKPAVTRTTVRASESIAPLSTTQTSAPVSSVKLDSPDARNASPVGSLPPTPPSPKMATVEETSVTTETSPTTAMLDAFHALERGFAEFNTSDERELETELGDASAENDVRDTLPAKKIEKTTRPAAGVDSPYKPSTAKDVVGTSDHANSVGKETQSSQPSSNPHKRKAPARVDARVTPASSSPPSQIDPVARQALLVMAPPELTTTRVESDNAAPWSAALDAETHAEAQRKREARLKVEALLGGAFDYDKIACVARATKSARVHGAGAIGPNDVRTARAFVPVTPPRVAPNGTARPRVAAAVETSELETSEPSSLDFFADVREAAVFGAGAGSGSEFAGDHTSVVLDTDASIDAFRAAIRAEVATRIVASASGITADASRMAHERHVVTNALRTSVPVATTSRGGTKGNARDLSRRRTPPPVRQGAWRPPPEQVVQKSKEGSAARQSIEARAEADYRDGRSRSAPARERPPESSDGGAYAASIRRSSEAPGALGLTARGVSAREAARRQTVKALKAAKARDDAERTRTADVEKTERAAEARRAAAEKARAEKVAFGRKVKTKGDGDAESGRTTPKPTRPKNTLVQPFKLSTGNHARGLEELTAERDASYRDPYVWEPSPAKGRGVGDSDAEHSVRGTPSDDRKQSERPSDEHDESANSPGEKTSTSPRLEEARRARDELKRRSRRHATRQSKVINAASNAAAPAIAAAEEARRDADAAAAAAARAAAAASAAEALMMAEARRLRERRKELYSRASKDAEFAPARSTLEMEQHDEPLMASYSSLPDMHVAAANLEREVEDSSRRRLVAEEVPTSDGPGPSSSPEKRGSEGNAFTLPKRVSALLASPSPAKHHNENAARDDPYAAFDTGTNVFPQRAPPFVFISADDGVVTPPSPRSPAVSWQMGALELPLAAMKQAIISRDDHRKTAKDAAVVSEAETEAPKSEDPTKSTTKQLPAVLRRAAEARFALAAANTRDRGSHAPSLVLDARPAALEIRDPKLHQPVLRGKHLLFRGADLAYHPPVDIATSADANDDGEVKNSEEELAKKHKKWLDKPGDASGQFGDSEFSDSGDSDGNGGSDEDLDAGR